MRSPCNIYLVISNMSVTRRPINVIVAPIAVSRDISAACTDPTHASFCYHTHLPQPPRRLRLSPENTPTVCSPYGTHSQDLYELQGLLGTLHWTYFLEPVRYLLPLRSMPSTYCLFLSFNSQIPTLIYDLHLFIFTHQFNESHSTQINMPSAAK